MLTATPTSRACEVFFCRERRVCTVRVRLRVKVREGNNEANVRLRLRVRVVIKLSGQACQHPGGIHGAN